jgi:poly(3-hydroxybutyrate) depolymerase
MKKSLFILILLLISYLAKSQDFKTIVYFTNDSLQLSLDLFLPKSPINEKTPLFIYVHGGGFSEGNKNIGHPICRYLSENGFAAASINYSLYMKNKDFGCSGILSEKVKAIHIAVNQLWQATKFFIKNQEEYKIDPTKIFVGGSSAGGTAALQAAFWNPDSMNIYQPQFHGKFKYAGVLSGSGALMDIKLIKTENLLPVMLSHGTCDNLVPYNIGAHHNCPRNSSGWIIMYGSYPIYKRIIEMNGSASLTTFCNGSHAYHNNLFEKDMKRVLDFMEKVLKDEKIDEHIIIKTGNLCKETKDYKFCD